MDDDKNIFLFEALTDGFEILRKTRIRFMVKENEEEETKKAWILAISHLFNWNYQDDYDRIHDAFIFIITQDKEFPTVARFLEVLQPREPPPSQRYISYTPEPPTEEQLAQKRIIQEMLSNLLQKMKKGETL